MPTDSTHLFHIHSFGMIPGAPLSVPPLYPNNSTDASLPLATS